MATVGIDCCDFPSTAVSAFVKAHNFMCNPRSAFLYSLLPLVDGNWKKKNIEMEN